MTAIAAIAVVGLAGGSRAEEPYQTRRLFNKGAWSVDLTLNTQTDDLWCAANTSNGQGQSLSLTGFPTGQLTFFVFDQSWRIAQRDIRFLVDIDYSRWTLDGIGSDISVSLTMLDAVKARKFVGELMEGSAVAIMNADGRRLAVFSLSGSYAAISKLLDCWQAIVDDATSSHDPFRSDTDPFN